MFRSKFSFDERVKKFSDIKRKYPSKLPLIVEARKESLLNLEQNKYLLEPDMTIGNFVYILSRRLKLKPEEALFIFINNKIYPTETYVSTLYKTEKDEDGFMYCTISTEDTFGNMVNMDTDK